MFPYVPVGSMVFTEAQEGQRNSTSGSIQRQRQQPDHAYPRLA